MKAFPFFFFIIILTSCNSVTNETGNSADTLKNNNISNRNVQPAKTITDFMDWYINNMVRLNNIPVVNNAFDTIYNPDQYYSVNFENTEEYLRELKKSKFISDKYLELCRAYYKECDKYFIEHPQNDGPPYGFDIDPIFWSQDYEDDLKNISKATVSNIQVSEKEAKLRLTFVSNSSIIFTLSKYGNNWLIDWIDSGHED